MHASWDFKIERQYPIAQHCQIPIVSYNDAIKDEIIKGEKHGWTITKPLHSSAVMAYTPIQPHIKKSPT